MPRAYRPDGPGSGGPTASWPIRCLWVAAGDAGDRWRDALETAGFDARVTRAADAAVVQTALRDPFDLILAWDDEAGLRAASVVVAVREAGAAIPVAAVAHPAAEEGLLRALAAGAVLGLEADQPRRLPAELRRILSREWLLARVALTGCIAHELNNLLASIPLAVQLLHRGSEPAAVQSQLASVSTASRRSMDTVKELSELLAADAPRALSVRAKHLLTLASRPWRLVPDGTPAVLTEYPPDLGSVRVDLVHVLQVLWCLARRALDDAGGQAGELLFSGRNLDRLPSTGEAGVELRLSSAPANGFDARLQSGATRLPVPSDGLGAILEVVEAQGGTLTVLEETRGRTGYALLLGTG